MSRQLRSADDDGVDVRRSNSPTVSSSEQKTGLRIQAGACGLIGCARSRFLKTFGSPLQGGFVGLRIDPDGVQAAVAQQRGHCRQIHFFDEASRAPQSQNVSHRAKLDGSALHKAVTGRFQVRILVAELMSSEPQVSLKVRMTSRRLVTSASNTAVSSRSLLTPGSSVSPLLFARAALARAKSAAPGHGCLEVGALAPAEDD